MYEYAIALTGGISTGKSTVASLLGLCGFRRISADEIAHKALQDNYLQIVELFGDEFVIDNKVDRKKLGNLIFTNKEAKQKLENLLHPIIQNTIQQEATKLDMYKMPYLVEIPLFFETKKYDIKNVLVVYAPRSVQQDRLIKRDNLTPQQAQDRLNNQLDIEDKKPLATYVIDNSKDLSHLQEECERFKQQVLSDICTHQG